MQWGLKPCKPYRKPLLVRPIVTTGEMFIEYLLEVQKYDWNSSVGDDSRAGAYSLTATA